MNTNLLTNSSLEEVSSFELEATQGGWLQTVAAVVTLVGFADQATGGELLKPLNVWDVLKKGKA